MKTKEILKARGVRLSDRQWVKLKSIAKKENKKNKDGNVTVSDVLRHAIDGMTLED